MFSSRWFYLGSSLVLAGLMVGWLMYGRWQWLPHLDEVERLTLPELDYLVKEPPVRLPEVRVIPRIVHLTYKDLSKIPPKVYDNLRQYAQGYEIYWYDDTNARDFLRSHFIPSVVHAFDTTPKGAHKADLLRYCLLYVRGGLYMDIKTVLIRPLDEIFNKPAVDTYFIHEYDLTSKEPQIYNGVIATYPRNPFFLQLIHNYLRTPPALVRARYTIFLRQMYNLLQVELSDPIGPGRYTSTFMELYLFSQKCTQKPQDCADGLDRYGQCCYLYDGHEKIIKVRYSDFPWV